jgi:hypothetical protein
LKKNLEEEIKRQEKLKEEIDCLEKERPKNYYDLKK